jgi:uncharacterized protein involved in type VI secretion and phage assembly
MSTDQDDETTHKRPGFDVGVVVNVNDPKGIGRIRARVPGLADATAWALPFALAGAGGSLGGAFVVPPVGHEVVIHYKNGDPDHPYYAPANYGAPNGKPRETPTPVRDLPPEEVPQVAVFEWGTYVVAIDDRPSKRALYLRDKRTGDEIQHDGEHGIWRIKGTSGVFIESDGRVQIEGATVVINGRVQREGPEPA